MATVMSMHWPEITKQQYEQVRGDVKWESNVPDGAKFHVAWFASDGLHVLDLWDSKADFERFCKGVQPGGGRIMQCMVDNQSRVSAPCAAVLAAKEKEEEQRKLKAK